MKLLILFLLFIDGFTIINHSDNDIVEVYIKVSYEIPVYFQDKGAWGDGISTSPIASKTGKKLWFYIFEDKEYDIKIVFDSKNGKFEKYFWGKNLKNKTLDVY